MTDRRSSGRHSLTADHVAAATGLVPRQDRCLSEGAVQMRLDHLQRETGGSRGIKAFPPFSRMLMPTAEASQCVEATAPKVPLISGRVVKAAIAVLRAAIVLRLGTLDHVAGQ